MPRHLQDQVPVPSVRERLVGDLRIDVLDGEGLAVESPETGASPLYVVK